ncbi:signal recognition particle-docking protein FtsY [Lactiplantibacillus paraxiangfangensis]|uniref:signal recognition particle-docking protein FtsY n=1 Tax=Lactiplantibacillus paraxiangfangensis TaxID=3076224 RepID=UPI0030C69DDA
MGLFSRLKKAFSLPESEESQASAAASEAVDSETSQASAGTSDVESAAASSAPVESPVASSEAPVSEAPVSAQVLSEAPGVESVAAESATASQAPDSEVASTEAESSAAPQLTASEAVAKSIAALKAAVASQSAAEAAPASEEVATVDETSEAPAEVSAATSEAVAESEAPADSEAEPTEAERYDEGLKKSRKTFGDRINAFLANFRHVDESFFDDLEDTLIESDVGYETAMRISDELRDEVKLQNVKSKKEISSVIVEKLVDMYGEAGKGEDNSIHMAKSGPTVILFVGVNGAGKTTTIGKMANMYKQQGKKVLLAACDTFRAGAIQQLQVWGERDGVDVVAGPEKSDPASVCFDAVKKAKAEDYDVLFVDTAGRLQNKVNLMNELEKIKRVITREIPDAPHEVLLVLDATTGQNALNQAKLFKQSTDVSGIVLTKLDGTARGGIVLAIRNELHLAVKYVGLGEKVTDLRPFNANDFVYGLFKDVITA